jgi:DnaJ-domain-containing protein 1
VLNTILSLDKSVILISAGFLVFLIIYGIREKNRDHESQFRLREADRVKETKLKRSNLELEFEDRTAHPNETVSTPLQLTGFVHDRPDHEILELSPNPSVSEIKRAYKKMMMRYHPDRVGRPGSPEWYDAQKIAERINLAKTRLLAKKN